MNTERYLKILNDMNNGITTASKQDYLEVARKLLRENTELRNEWQNLRSKTSIWLLGILASLENLKVP